MDEKALKTLEFFKILDKLADYCAFAVSAEKARSLRPTDNIEEARRRQAETREALQLMVTHSDLTIGGARDIRASLDLASRGGVLTPSELLDVKSTLISARSLARTFERLEPQYPYLYAIAGQIPPNSGLIDAITRTISERAEVLDSASPKLASIRRDMRISHDRLMTKLQRMVSDPKMTPYLQEAIITQRDGRYVLPLRSEFKGRIKSVVHDQSSSGATLFIEPLGVVDMNNEYREKQLAERDEERRILYELSVQIGDRAEEIKGALEIISDLDLALAKGKYAEDLHATEPRLAAFPIRKGEPPRQIALPPEKRNPECVIRLFVARHPLLDPQTVVPVDVELDPATYVLVITGPNTGGKTVTLKTVGLLAMMAQAGLHIPAHSGSEISVFHNIYADIGDEQSIEQSLSTFSSHITNIKRILQHADRRSLVILDELGAGTDPQEGAALAGAILTHLLEHGITTLVTTHHPELKAYAHATPGVVNGSVEFDLHTLRPTFRLTIGLPGRSNALAIAERLGLDNAIINDARSELNPQDLRAEDLLDEIHRQRDLARNARETADRDRQEAESVRRELALRLEKIEDERRNILIQAQNEAEEQVRQLQDEIRDIRKSLERSRQPLEVIQAAEEQLQNLEEEVEKPVERLPQKTGGKVLRREVWLGDKVRLRSLNVQGIVTALGEEEAEVQVGMLRVRARLADLAPLGEEPAAELNAPDPKTYKRKPRTIDVTPQPDQPAPKKELFAPSPGMEIDLRGQRAEDALDALDRYLDAAYLAGLPFVRIIHGKGTGKLRQAVREALGHNPNVKSHSPGADKEGGDGVTVAKLAVS